MSKAGIGRFVRVTLLDPFDPHKETTVANTSASFRKHVMDVRRSLAALDRSLGVLSASMNGNGAAHTGRARATRRLSPRARAALKLQGRYMGYMRQLKPKQKTL